MNPITLTELQKSKLLEMCKTLFTNYNDIHMYVNGWEYDRDKDYIAFTNTHNPSDYVEFHWFEFCMTHLFDKLECGEEEADNMLNLKISHPIDYLYEEFKKLKQ